MNNLVDLQLQIEKLQKQASQIKAKEFNKTVLEIREKMHAFGITVKDLKPEKNAKSTVVREVTAKKPKALGKKIVNAPVAAKFRGPEGEAWTGRGLTPRWLKMLLEQGRTKEEFLIAPEISPAE
jgi:DNA-binding protein H-NS